MKIGIIDDEKPSRSELIYLINKIVPNVEIVEMKSGEEALELIARESFDLLCIDINLGDISGTTLAATARKLLPNVEIVFATAYNNYAENAFEVDSLYYLLKPFSEAKVKRMMEKYNKKHQNIDKSESNQNKDSSHLILKKIPVSVDKSIVLIDVSSIVYIEVKNHTCIIHTKTKDYIDSKTPLREYEEKLCDSGFFRIQKSFLVNLKYILEIYPWFSNSYCVRMQGFENEILPISRNRIKELKLLLNI
jgi:DNA-binding LytR/AlgR family response regulator